MTSAILVFIDLLEEIPYITPCLQRNPCAQSVISDSWNHISQEKGIEELVGLVEVIKTGTTLVLN